MSGLEQEQLVFQDLEEMTVRVHLEFLICVRMSIPQQCKPLK
jgi:hypothetical protein